jgi:pSer/pThr/pTyr-binding forkhead associated (FHA) protein
MHRLQIPYNSVIFTPIDFEEGEFNSLLRKLLIRSLDHPIILEVFNNQIQYFLFIRDGQLYWAGTHTIDEFGKISIKDFFVKLGRTQFPRVVAYDTNLILFHSLLVCMQKETELKVSSALVDLEELLEKTASEKKDGLIVAYQPGNLILLRYKDSKPVACYKNYCGNKLPEENALEEFLVTTYTHSTHKPFEIMLYTDLVVERAKDSRPIPEENLDNISAFYLSQPPKLVVKLKNRPLKTYQFVGKTLTIGRLSENDIVIDNLSVSRNHASISTAKAGYILKDLGSKNKTYLNGKEIETSKLKNGDTITIGKYQIVFKIPTPVTTAGEQMDQTVVIPNYHPKSDKLDIDFSSVSTAPARLLQLSNQEEHILSKEKTTIGKKKDDDIRFSGIFISRIKVEINRIKDNYTIKKIKGKKDVIINGEKIEEKVLAGEDLIAIGSEEFVFKI